MVAMIRLHWFFCVRLLLCAACLSGAVNPSIHAQGANSEYQVKAAFLYQFASYVDWPADSFASADAPLQIGVLDADELAQNLETISEQRLIHGRAVQVRRLRNEDTADGLHVLFIGKSASPSSLLLEQASHMPVLSITEAAGSRPDNSIINFRITDERIRFDISTRLAERNQLRISARLLSVAQRVVR